MASIFLQFFSDCNCLKTTKSDKKVTYNDKCNLLICRMQIANFALTNSVKPYKNKY